jgi:hypothetical protein
MSDSNEGGNCRVTWRLPVELADRVDGDWDRFRDMLARWVDAKKPLPVPELPEDTKSCCFMIEQEILDTLEQEAKRLSAATGRKWTAGRVARTIYELDAYDLSLDPDQPDESSVHHKYVEEIHLDDEDLAIMDAVWDEMGERMRATNRQAAEDLARAERKLDPDRLVAGVSADRAHKTVQGIGKLLRFARQQAPDPESRLFNAIHSACERQLEDIGIGCGLLHRSVAVAVEYLDLAEKPDPAVAGAGLHLCALECFPWHAYPTGPIPFPKPEMIPEWEESNVSFFEILGSHIGPESAQVLGRLLCNEDGLFRRSTWDRFSEMMESPTLCWLALAELKVMTTELGDRWSLSALYRALQFGETMHELVLLKNRRKKWFAPAVEALDRLYKEELVAAWYGPMRAILQTPIEGGAVIYWLPLALDETLGLHFRLKEMGQHLACVVNVYELLRQPVRSDVMVRIAQPHPQVDFRDIVRVRAAVTAWTADAAIRPTGGDLGIGAYLRGIDIVVDG